MADPALAELARQGAVYEIEDWIAATRRAEPDRKALCDEVERRLAGLDFAGIVELCGGG